MPETAAVLPNLRLPQLRPGMAKAEVSKVLANWASPDIYRSLLSVCPTGHEDMVRRAGAINASRAVSGVAAKMFGSQPEGLAGPDFRRHLDHVLGLLAGPGQEREALRQVDEYLAKNGFRPVGRGAPASPFWRPGGAGNAREEHKGAARLPGLKPPARGTPGNLRRLGVQNLRGLRSLGRKWCKTARVF